MPKVVSLAVLTAGLLGIPGCGAQSIDQGPSSPPPSSVPPPVPPLPPPPPTQQVTASISVDTTVRFQRMKGWEATSQAGQDDPGFAGFRGELMDLAAYNLGLNRIRLELRSGAENPVDYYAQYLAGSITENAWQPTRYSWVNDNLDPMQANPAGFHFTELDRSIEASVLPMRQRLAARGEALYLNLNYVSFGNSPAHQSPAEYAEFIYVTFQHIQTKYGFVPDAVEIILEPDNNTIWRGPAIGELVTAVGTRLDMAGWRPDIIAPSVTNMANTVSYLDQIAASPGARTYLTDVSYHRYAGVSDATLAAIAARAAQLNLRTAMLEHIGSDVEDLYKDLTIANVSAWQQYTLAFPSGDNGGHYYGISNGHPVAGVRTLALRQYFRYVRMGAYRVAATSDTPRVRPVAFTNTGGDAVVVLHASQGEVASVSGLRPGRYGVFSSPASVAGGQAIVGADGVLRFALLGAGIVTVYWLP